MAQMRKPGPKKPTAKLPNKPVKIAPRTPKPKQKPMPIKPKTTRRPDATDVPGFRFGAGTE